PESAGLSLSAPAPARPSPLSLHDALPIWPLAVEDGERVGHEPDLERLRGRPRRPVQPGRALRRRLARHARAGAAEHALAERAGEIGKHTSELQSRSDLVCRLLLEKKKKNN